MTQRILTVFAILILTSACQGPDEPDRLAEAFTSESLLEPIEILSSDEFEGRAPATRGEDLTVNYLVSYLESHGIEPGGEGGSYLQSVPLSGQTVNRQSARMRFLADGGSTDLNYYDEFMAWPVDGEETLSIRDAELLYVGYGIEAPEYGWDDYKGVDVSGKILVYKNSDPSYDPDLFEGDTRLYYGRWSYKFEKAEEMGALGALIIHTEPTAGYPWQVVANSWGRERYFLPDEDADSSPVTRLNGWITEDVSEELFRSTGQTLSEILEAADDPDFQPVPLNGVRLEADLQAEYMTEMSTRNVIGKLEGADPELNHQYLVFTAHYDHLGITEPVEGDSVNNGALDNAAGVSAVLNLARAYGEAAGEFRRSILFLFVGAEEMGLLGSQYWAQNPTVHPGRVTANINLDGMNVYGETEDIVLIGYGRNSVSDVVERVAVESGRTVKPDSNPTQGYFYRSDHFSLAKVGIPAVFPRAGNQFIEKPAGYRALVESLTSANYHSVHDQINEYWDLRGMVQDVALFYAAGLQVLNADEMMEWRSGDEFESTRLQMIREAGSE